MNTGKWSFYSPFAKKVADDLTKQTLIARCVEHQKLAALLQHWKIHLRALRTFAHLSVLTNVNIKYVFS